MKRSDVGLLEMMAKYCLCVFELQLAAPSRCATIVHTTLSRRPTHLAVSVTEITVIFTTYIEMGMSSVTKTYHSEILLLDLMSQVHFVAMIA